MPRILLMRATEQWLCRALQIDLSTYLHAVYEIKPLYLVSRFCASVAQNATVLAHDAWANGISMAHC
jgi:hypothetical protein